MANLVSVSMIDCVLKKFNYFHGFRKAINKGIGVDNLHYLNDGLWKV